MNDEEQEVKISIRNTVRKEDKKSPLGCTSWRLTEILHMIHLSSARSEPVRSQPAQSSSPITSPRRLYPDERDDPNADRLHALHLLLCDDNRIPYIIAIDNEALSSTEITCGNRPGNCEYGKEGVKGEKAHPLELEVQLQDALYAGVSATDEIVMTRRSIPCQT